MRRIRSSQALAALFTLVITAQATAAPTDAVFVGTFSTSPESGNHA